MLAFRAHLEAEWRSGTRRDRPRCDWQLPQLANQHRVPDPAERAKIRVLIDYMVDPFEGLQFERMWASALQ